ncbi:ROK family transcriptional regulator [Paractinoplanes rishiriensis]|nr:ROK family transcriptional regulator [Actinoplanes rishiriensis]
MDAIRASEPLSRVELAAMTGLTEAAVSMTVRRLLGEGLIVETGRTPTAGKPRTLLRLDPGARIAVGIYLDELTTTYVLTGQTGGILSRLARPAPDTADRPALLRALVADVNLLLAGSGVDPDRCLGVGVVWPAAPHSRPEDGPARLHGWRGDDLGRELEKATGWPVLVENDATAAAVGEYWVARVGPDQAFAALYMGTGLGAGIVLDGRAMRGGRGHAGEFGHLCVQTDGPPCWCGGRGCLEALAGPRTVVGAALADPRAAGEAGLVPAGPRRSVADDFAAVARAARGGAPCCRDLLEDSARHVAAAAESVVNLIDLDLVVLTGPGFAAASFIYGPAIMRRIGAADTRTWHRSVTVTVSLAAATASATGAAALVLQSHLRR